HPCGAGLPLLLGPLPGALRGRTGEVPVAATRANACSRGHDLHLPDAPGDPPDRSGYLSPLRHGAGTGDAEPGGGGEPGVARLRAPVLVDPAADLGGPGAGDV